MIAKQIAFLLFNCCFLIAVQAQRVTLKVDMSAVENPSEVGVRGGVAPLSWEKTYPMTDEDGDGIYEATLNFKTKDQKVEYKYIYGESNWELDGMGNRTLDLTKKTTVITEKWNMPRLPSKAEIEANKISVAGLQEDFEILKQAYLELHPGLYRYNSKEEMEALFDDLQKELQPEMTIPEAYLAFSRFSAKIKCGHTFANFWNQGVEVSSSIFLQPDKVPFLFTLLDKRMIITKSADTEQKLLRGTEILSINGTPVKTIIDQLLPLVKGDGNKMAKRLKDLNLTNLEKHEYFDVFFPLLFPPNNNQYELEVIDPQSKKRKTLTVDAIARSERRKVVEERFGAMPTKVDDTWEFKLIDDKTAYMKLGTFTVWQMEMDWKNWIKDAFKTMQEQNIENFIIDIRGNEGGLDEVGELLMGYLLKSDVQVENMKGRVTYQKVSEATQPYVGTWEKTYFDLTNRVEPAEEGFFKMKGEKEEPYITYKASNNKLLFKGKIYMLIDAANSSATFYMARTAKKGKLATLVGETTGGNQRGTNGGMMFFLNLPNSKVELDIPLIASFPYEPKPDAGIDPDIVVKPTFEDILNDIDRPLETILSIIAGRL